MATKATTTYTFAVTFQAPHKVSIVEARKFIREAIAGEVNARNPDDAFKDLEFASVKVHLTNKETSYGKR